MSLCLVVTRTCNLRCSFCRVEFTGQDMSWETARLAVDRYLEGGLDAASPAVKLFGGEPLLNWGLVRRLVEEGRGRWAKHALRFELSSNGSYLDEEKLAYLAARPEVAVTLSFPHEGGASLPGVWQTVVLPPGTGPRTVVERLRGLLRQGYRRFNFLPAYFTPWTEAELAELRLSFEAAARVILGLRGRGRVLRVRNLEVRGSVALFNDLATVDVDGNVYASNMIECAGMEKARARLRVGSIDEPGILSAAPRSDAETLQGLVREWAGPEAWESTRRVDEALTDFVVRLKSGAVPAGEPIEA